MGIGNQIVETGGKKYVLPLLGGIWDATGGKLFKKGAKEVVEQAGESTVKGAEKSALDRLRNFGKKSLWTAGGLGGAQILMHQLDMKGPFDYLSDWLGLEQPAPAVDSDVVSILAGLERTDPVKASEMFQKFLDEQSKRRANRPALPDLMAGYDAQAAAAQNSLNNYLNTMGTYAGNQSRAITDAYSRMASNLQKSADDTFTRGQMTAADLENLYAGLAGQQAAMAAGAGQATPASQTAGLAAPSGAAATAPQTTRTYGRGLADYLGREAGIESGAISRTAQSQALQGAGMAAGLNDYLAMKSADLQFQLANQLAASRTEAQQKQAMMEYELAMADLDYESQAGQQMLEYQMEEQQMAQAEEDERYNSAVSASYLWNGLDEAERATVVKSLGLPAGSGADEFIKAVYENPALLAALES